MLKIEIKEESVKDLTEKSMETLRVRADPKEGFKRIHYSLLLFVFVQVIWLFTFSEPLTVLWGSTPLFPDAISDSVLTRTGRLVLIYHALAMPFLVANTFWLMEYYEIREKWTPTLKILLEPGAYAVGISGLVFAYTGLHLFHTIMYFGMFMVFVGGIVFMIAAWPVPNKFPDPKTAQEGSLVWGFSLENYALVVLAFCVLFSSIYGALSALENFTGTIWGLDRDPIGFLAESIVRYNKFEKDVVENMIVSHLHIQLAQSSAMVVMVGFKTTHIPPKTYKLVLISNPIGVLIISWGAWILDHPIIWVGAGILIIGTTIMAVTGLIEISKQHLGEQYETASRWEKAKSMVKDPVRFTYYYVFLYAQIVVTICGIVVGLQTVDVFRQYDYTFIEYDFNVGHWHLLAVLLAVLLMIQAVDYIHVRGRPRQWFGWLMFIGSSLAFSGANFYMLRAPKDQTFWSLAATYIGVYFLFVGFVQGIYLLVKTYKQDQLEMKLGINNHQTLNVI